MPNVDSAAEAAARLRDLYRRMDTEEGAREGHVLAARFPFSTEVRAWYVASLLSTDSALALRTARDHRWRQCPL
jgi:hypothetical protein